MSTSPTTSTTTRTMTDRHDAMITADVASGYGSTAVDRRRRMMLEDLAVERAELERQLQRLDWRVRQIEAERERERIDLATSPPPTSPPPPTIPDTLARLEDDLAALRARIDRHDAVQDARALGRRLAVAARAQARREAVDEARHRRALASR